MLWAQFVWGYLNFEWHFLVSNMSRALWILVYSTTLGGLNGSIYITMCNKKCKLMWQFLVFGKTVLGDENIWKWMKHVNLIIIFFRCRCNTAHGLSYLDADICPRILFLDTCLVCVSFTCLTCVWQVTWMLLSLSDSEESIFPELGHSMNWTQKKEKTYINNKTICNCYSCRSLKWGSNVYFFIGILTAFLMDVWNNF